MVCYQIARNAEIIIQKSANQDPAGPATSLPQGPRARPLRALGPNSPSHSRVPPPRIGPGNRGYPLQRWRRPFAIVLAGFNQCLFTQSIYHNLRLDQKITTSLASFHEDLLKGRNNTTITPESFHSAVRSPGNPTLGMNRRTIGKTPKTLVTVGIRTHALMTASSVLAMLGAVCSNTRICC